MMRTLSILFIDASVQDKAHLLAGIKPGVRTHILTPGQDGVAQITEVIRHQYSDYDLQTIHIVAHGAPGCLYLGSGKLSISTLNQHAQNLTAWRARAIALYGCNVAVGDAGEELINKLHHQTLANIYASTTMIGNSTLGGNWKLDTAFPTIFQPSYAAISPSYAPFSPETLASYPGVLSEAAGPHLSASSELETFPYPVSLLFIDHDVEERSVLLEAVKPGINVYILPAHRDGVEQITDILVNEYSHCVVESIHIVAHGAPGSLYLSSTELGLGTLSHYAASLQAWPSTEVFLYSCNVAAGDAGEEFLLKLRSLTGADIYASKTKVGHADLNGSWVLEAKASRGSAIVLPTRVSAEQLFSAEALAEYPGVLSPDGGGFGESVSESVRPKGTPAVQALTVIDAGVPNQAMIIADLVERGMDYVVLDAYADGIEQISKALADRSGLDALHIISHGSQGQAQLGNATLSQETLDEYADALTEWGNALSADGDILFYGCDLAQGTEGVSLIAEIADLTGADVAASDDLTGAASLGGDWDLEVASGQIETHAIEVTDWQGLLTETAPANSFATLLSGGSIVVDGVTITATTTGTVNNFAGDAQLDAGAHINPGFANSTSSLTLNFSSPISSFTTTFEAQQDEEEITFDHPATSVVNSLNSTYGVATPIQSQATLTNGGLTLRSNLTDPTGSDTSESFGSNSEVTWNFASPVTSLTITHTGVDSPLTTQPDPTVPEDTNYNGTIIGGAFSLAALDADGDGVSDGIDLDDDNDGILDAAEQTVSVITGNASTKWTVSNSNIQGQASVPITINGAGNAVTGTLSQTGGSFLNGSETDVIRFSEFGDNFPNQNWTLDLDEPVYDLELFFGNLERADATSGRRTIEIYNFELTLEDGTVISGADFNLSNNPHGFDTAGATRDSEKFTRNGTPAIRPQDQPSSIGNQSNATLDFTDLSGSVGVTRVTWQVDAGGPNGGGPTSFVGVYGQTVGEVTTYTDVDTDGDGVFDRFDLDSDNDGISDLIESLPSGTNIAAIDADGNGQYDLAGTQTNGVDDNYNADGVSLNASGGTGNTPEQTDGDGVADYLDLDSDADGIPDAVEAQPTDTYTSVSDGTTVAVDANGVNTAVGLVTPENTDSLADGADYRDLDSDEDGATDAAEGPVATITPTYANPDGDITDSASITSGTVLKNADSNASDADFRSLDAPLDTDGDGVPDIDDLDDDNDGILDTEEGFSKGNLVTTGAWTTSGNSATYDFGNGVIVRASKTGAFDFAANSFNSAATSTFWNENLAGADSLLGDFDWNDQVTFSFEDANGNSVEVTDVVLHLDRVGGHTGSTQNSALVTLQTGTWTQLAGTNDFSSTATTVEDSGAGTTADSGFNAESTLTDSDGTAAGSLQLNDPVTSFTLNMVQSGPSGAGGDAFEFILEAIMPNTGTVRDTDSDGIADHLDLDSDNDGISDLTEALSSGADISVIDSNADGRYDLADTQTNGVDDNYNTDGVALAANGGTGNIPEQTDSDGVADYLDLDSDADGIPDAVEAQSTATYTSVSDDTAVAVDANGVNTAIGLITPENTDSLADGADYRDLDSDEDGTADTAEGSVSTITPTYANPDGDITDAASITGGTILQNADSDASDADFRSINNDPPVISTPTGAPAAINFAENGTGIVANVESSDTEDGAETNLTYSLSGTDAALFSIDTDGNLSFINPPDFETPLDDDGDNIYDLTVTVTDSGNLTDTQDIRITVTDINENLPPNAVDDPAVESGADTLDKGELTGGHNGNNQSVVTGTDGTVVTVSTLAGDALQNTGATVGLGMGRNTAQDSEYGINFSNPVDTAEIKLSYFNNNGDGNEEIRFTVLDASGVDITNSVSFSFFDGSTIGGLTFGTSPSTGAANTISAAPDSNGEETNGTLSITAPAGVKIGDVNMLHHRITGSGFGVIIENVDYVVNAAGAPYETDEATVLSIPAVDGVIGNDTDPEGDTLTVTEVDGVAASVGNQVTLASGALLTLNSDGSFDYDPNGQYDSLDIGQSAADTFTYTIADPSGQTDTATVTVTINGLENNTPPVIDTPTGAPAAFSIEEGMSAVTNVDSTDTEDGAETNLTYSLSGDDAALFAIDPSGNLSFVTPPDFETPTDTGTNNVYDVTVTVTDSGSLTDTQDIQVTITDRDEIPPLPTITVNDITPDNTVNAAESGQPIPVTGVVGGEFKVGDTVTLTINGNDFTGTVLDAAGNYSIDVPGSDLADDDDTTISASVTTVDDAGNTGTATTNHAYLLDTTAPAPTIEIDNITLDNIVNAAEEGTDIPVTGTVGDDFNDGDTVTLTVNGKTFTGPVNAAGEFSIDVPGTDLSADPDVTVDGSITTTDAAGNTGTATDNHLYGVDVIAAAPVITVDDITPDNIINIAEEGGDVPVTGTVTGEFMPGDTVTLTINGKPFTGPVDAAGKFSIDVPGTDLTADPDVTVDAVIDTIDPAGNPGSATNDHLYGVDNITPTAPVVEIIEDINNDGLINDTELVGTIEAKVTVNPDIVIGDNLVVTDQAGTELFNGPVTQTIIDDGLIFNLNNTADGTPLQVFAQVTDQVGNVSPTATDSALVDDTVPATPLVVIDEDINDDGFISNAEIDGTVQVTVTPQANTEVGDTMVVKLPDGTELFNDPLTQAQIDNGITFDLTAPTEGDSITVNAVITDPAGNVSPMGTDTAILDTTAPVAPTVVITEDTNDDGLISDSELVGTVEVAVGLPTAQVGDVLVVTDQAGNELFNDPVTQPQIDNGLVFSVSGVVDGSPIEVTATLTDPAGNVSPEASDTAVLDLSAPSAPIVTIDEDLNNDGFIDVDELDGDIQVTVELPNDVEVGDTLVVTDHDGTELFNGPVTQDMLDNDLPLDMTPPANGTPIEVIATVTDAAGNESPEGKDAAILDAVAPPAPVITITEDIDNNELIGASELVGNVDIRVDLQPGTEVGDILTVLDQSGTELFSGPVNQFQIDNGLVFNRPSPGEGGTITVFATVTDDAGNTSSPASIDTATIDTIAPGAPTVNITEDTNNDGLIGTPELSGPIDALVELPTDAKPGDTLVVTDQDGTELFNDVIDQNDIDNGVTVEVPNPGDGSPITVTAQVIDEAGNPGPTADDTALLDFTAPTAPIVTITEDANDDALISNAELIGTVEALVEVPDADVGDILIVTDQTGTELYNAPVTLLDIANGVEVTPATPAEGDDVVVTATLTDPAGNVSLPGEDTTTLDTTPPSAPVVVINEDVNDDGLISAGELTGPINATVEIPTVAEVGDILKVVDQAGNVLFDEPITQDHIDNGVPVETTSPGDNQPVEITATLTDPAGNVSDPGADDALLDLTAPIAPIVTITEDANNDELISAGELNGTVQALVETPDAQIGDRLIVTDQTGAEIFNDLVTQDIIDNGVEVTAATPFEDEDVMVTATLTDPAGNVSDPSMDKATIDTTPPSAPVVVINEDVNDDGLISAGELDGPINATVEIPTDAEVGDTLKVVDQAGNVLFDEPITQDHIDNGVPVEATPPADGQPVEITATLTDPAGNVSDPGTDDAILDLTAPTAPIVTITEDANNDELISAGELNAPTVEALVKTPDAQVGDRLIVTDQTGAEIFNDLVTQDIIDNGVEVSAATPLEGEDVTVTATLTDPAGNVSDPAMDKATIDTTPPSAPVVVIDEDVNDDGLISAGELDGPINATVEIPTDAEVGDTLKVVDQDGNVLFDEPITQDHIDNGVPVEATPSADGQPVEITATLTDPAGNVSDPGADDALLDLTAPIAPIVTITEDANNDELISAGELNAPTVEALVETPDAQIGDRLIVTDQTGAEIFNDLVTQDIIDNGVEVSAATPLEDEEVTVTATLTDPAGNVSDPAMDKATIDTTPPSAPVVVIDEDVNNDGLISAGELNGPVNATVTVPTDAEVGDILSVVDQAGNELFNAPLTQDDIDNGVPVETISPGDGQPVAIIATLTDHAGNESDPGIDDAILDLTAPTAPTVTITEDANDDALISAGELNGTIEALVEVPDAEVGDTLVVIDQTGTEIFNGPVTQDHIDNGLEVIAATPLEGEDVIVTATLTDPAGNESGPGTDAATIDTTPPGAPVVVITEDANDNGLISGNELDAPTVQALVTVPNADLGDTLVVTDQTGAEIFNGSVTQDILDNGIEVNAATPAEGDDVVVTATLTDPAGNVSDPGTDAATIDTTPPSAPVVVIDEDANDDGLISAGELTGPINATVELPADAEVGDTLTVTDQAGNVLFDEPITQDHLDNGVPVEATAPGDGQPVEITATLTDPAGNESPEGIDAATLDLTAPIAPIVTITEDANDDELISAGELNAPTVEALVETPDAQVGDRLIVTDQTGAEIFNGLVTQDIIDNGVEVNAATPLEGEDVMVTATLTDPAGNVSDPAMDKVTIDTTPPSAPVVVIDEDANDDGLISVGELTGPINATVELPADAQVGDTLTVTDQAGNVLFDEPITQDHIDNGVLVEAIAPTDGQPVEITATLTDPAGNESPEGIDAATLDLTAPIAPIVTITEDANDDELISAGELNAPTVEALVETPDAQVGDTLIVTDQTGAEIFNGLVTQDIIDNGVEVSAATPLEGEDVMVTATLTDPAGNVSDPAMDKATIDTTPPSAPIVTITEDANDDALLSDGELDGTVEALVEVPGDAQIGDTLVVNDQAGNELFNGPVTQDIIDNGVEVNVTPPAEGNDVVVTATLTDPAGNTSPEGSDTATIDTTPPSAPVVVINEDVNDDGFINSDELDGPVNATVELPTDARPGDTLTVTDQDGNVLFDEPITQDHIDNGVPVEATPPADGQPVEITATLTDPAGNESPEGMDAATLDLTAPSAPVVVIHEDANDDGLISDGELDGLIQSTVTLLPDVQVGDNLTVTDQAGNVLFDAPVLQNDLDNGVIVNVAPPADGSDVTVSAVVTDPAGNVSPEGTDTATLDLTAPSAPVVVINEDVNDDGLLSEGELEGPVNATVELPTDAQPGDTLMVVDQDGNVLFDEPITQDHIDNGVPVETTPPADGQPVEITVTLTDPAGNESPEGMDAATVDLTAPVAPIVTITEDANDDELISDSELEGTVEALVETPDAQVGDTLVVTDQTGAEIFNGLVTQDIIDNGVEVSAATPDEGEEVMITATLTDPAGNVSDPAMDKATIDTMPPSAPVVVIDEDINDDGFISDGELNGPVNATVEIPTDAQPGDTLTVTDQDGNVLFDEPITQDHIDNGVPVETTPPADGQPIEITATLTDPAGNESPEGMDAATVDLTAPVAPIVTITEDANDDELISDGELNGTVEALVEIPDADVGDTLIVTDQAGNELFNAPVTLLDIANGVEVSVTPPAEGEEVMVTATLTDPAGNVSDPAMDKATIDTTPPSAPVVVINEDANDDGLISEGELEGPVNATVELPTDAQPGDTLTVTDQDGNVLFDEPITQDHIDNGVPVEATAPEDGQPVEITAKLTDPAGNESPEGTDAALVDLTAPIAPIVTITEDANNDELISDGELDGTVEALVETPDAQIGDTLVVTDQTGAELFNGLVTQDIIDNGIEVSATTPAEGEEVVVTATLTDPAGNVSDPAMDKATIDTTAPSAPVVTITEDPNDDGLISEGELEGPVNAVVELPTDAQPGDTLTVVDQDGNVLFDEPITQEHIDNGVPVETTAPEDGQPVEITATVTDPAGNESPEGTDGAIIDTTPPSAPVVVIDEDANDDGLISDGELDGPVNATVELPTDAQVGDTLMVTDQDGNVLFDEPITQDNIDNGVPVETTAPEDGQPVEITATLTDPAGNTSPEGMDEAILDLTAPSAPVVTITEDPNDDGLISDGELDGLVNAIVELPTDAQPGDTLTVVDQDGNVLFDEPITQDHIDNGVPVETTAPEDGQPVEITATVTDPAGNESPEGTDGATIDTTPPSAPVVVIDEDTNDDGLISEGELDGPVNATVELPTDAQPGDTLTVTDQDGNVLFDEPITQDHIDNGVPVETTASEDGQPVEITATLTDPAGNESPEGMDAATVDLTSPVAPMVTITEDANDDALISDGELDGTVEALVEAPDAEIGDTLTVTDQAGNELFNGPVTQDIIDNGVEVSVTPPAEGEDVMVTATLTDPAGNVSDPGTDAATIDTTPPSAPVVVIDEDVNDDGLLSDGELDGPVNATVELPTDAQPGDTLTVTDQDGNVLFDEPITQDHIDNGVPVETAAPEDGQPVEIRATLTDPAGNESPEGVDGAIADLTAPIAPIVTITEDANNDELISDGELEDTVEALVETPNAEIGDTLVVTDQTGAELFNGLVTQDIIDNGVEVSAITPADGEEVMVTATLTDPAGNVSDPAMDKATIDTTAPSAPVVVIDEDANDDGLISEGELDGPVNATVEIPTDAQVGDTLTVTDQDGNVLFDEPITQDHIDNGVPVETIAPGDGQPVEITATLTDPAGNESPEGMDAATVDLTAPSAPVVVIDEDANDDGLISDGELDGPINATVELPTDAQPGDTLTVVDQDGNVLFDEPITQDHIDNGVPVEATPPADGQPVEITATVTDPAGNPSPEGTDDALLDLTAPSAPIVTIIEDANNDGLISDAELVGTVEVQVDLPPEAQVGDNLIVTDQSGTELFNAPVTQVHLDNGLVFNLNVEDGSPVEVSATLTDAAGNVSPEGSDTAVLDATPPSAPIVTLIEDDNNDGVIDANEADGPIDALVELPADTQPGDILVVTDPEGNELFNGPVTQEHIDDGLTFPIDQPAEGEPVTVTATLTDPAGNTSPEGSDRAIFDDQPPAAPVITIIEDTNDDGLLSDDELQGTIEARVEVSPETQVGDILFVADQSGNVLFDGPLNQIQITNGLLFNLSAPAEGNTLTLSTTLTDAAGNVSPISADSVIVDITAPSAPAVTITEDPNDDGLISDGELDGPVNATVELPADAQPGDTLTVTDQDGNVLFDEPITQDHIDNGVLIETSPPADGQPVEITATLTDPAGNESPEGVDGATVDTTAPPAPIITIIEDANNDGLISDAELEGTVQSQVELIDGTEVGDILLVTDQTGAELFNGPVTQSDIDNGVIVSTDAPPEGEDVVVTATVTDPAGNTSSPASTDAATIDTTAPDAPTAPDLIPASDSGLSDADDYTNDNTPTFTGNAPDGEPGDTLTLYIDGVALGTTTLDADGNYTVTIPDAAALSDGPIDVTVTVTDAVGNESVASPALPVVIDTTAPTDLTVDGPIADNNVVGNAEQQSVVINGQQAEPTSTVEVTFSDGVTTLGPIAAIVNPDGTWSTPGANLTSLSDGNITVSVTETDLAGNTGTTATAEFTKQAESSSQSSGGSDVITGGDGNNIINGLSDDDTLDGGGGNDVVNGGSDLDVVLGGTGHDVLNGGSSGDNIEAGDGNDIINSGSGDDVAYGQAGIDVMNGGSGSDMLHGGTGNDLLTGGTGDDLLFGGAGQDLLRGGSGDDTLTGGDGADFLSGGQGSDIFAYTQVSEFGDTIQDFEIVRDRIDLSQITNGNASLGSSITAQQAGQHAAIFSGADQVTLLLNVNADTLDESNFIF